MTPELFVSTFLSGAFASSTFWFIAWTRRPRPRKPVYADTATVEFRFRAKPRVRGDIEYSPPYARIFDIASDPENWARFAHRSPELQVRGLDEAGRYTTRWTTIGRLSS